MDIVICEATKEDAALIASLSRQTFYETFSAKNAAADMEKFLSEQFTRSALMAEVGAPGNTFLLAYVNGHPAGYARLREDENRADADSLEIARLYAVKNMIGKGVGKALMQACMNLAIAKQKRRIWLGVWEANEQAIRFYEAWGFEKVGEHDFILGNDVQRDWIMQRNIS